MKKLYSLLLLLTAILLSQCTDKMPTEIERPYHGLQSSKSIEIAKIVRTDTSTVLHIDAYFRPKAWIRIDSATYLKADGQKFVVQSSEGIKLHEHHYMPESGEDHFTLTFPPLPKGVKSFDFIESDCDDCFKIWDIDLTGKAVDYTPDIPAEVLNQEVDQSATLAPPIFKVGKTKLTVHLTGLREGYVMGDASLYVGNPFTLEQDNISAEKDAENKYVFEIDQYVSAQAILILGYKQIPVYLNPGEQAEIYLDMTALSKKESRYHPQEDLKYIAFKGDFQSANNLIAYAKLDNKGFDMIDPENHELLDLTKEQYLDKLFSLYSERVAAIENENCPPVVKQNLKNQLKSSSIFFVSQMQMVYETVYRMKNKVKGRDAIDYKAPQAADEDYLRLKDLELNDPSWLYDLSFTQVSVFLIALPDNILNEITGSETGFLQDLKSSHQLMTKAQAMEALTADEEKKLGSLSDPYFAEVQHAIYKNTVQLYDDAIKKGGFTIEESPQAANDKILEAIVAKYKGQAVFVDLWATWCGPCLMGMKTIKPIKPQMKDKGVVSIYLTNTSSPKTTWMNMLPDIGGIHYYLNDAQWEAIRNKYKFSGIPTYMIFDKTGKKTYQQSGYPGNEKILKELGKVW